MKGTKNKRDTTAKNELDKIKMRDKKTTTDI